MNNRRGRRSSRVKGRPTDLACKWKIDAEKTRAVPAPLNPHQGNAVNPYTRHYGRCNASVHLH